MADPTKASAFDFYTLEGATALRDKLASFEGGRILVHISEMPIKCPVAPLEFAFLADDYFRKRRIRHKVDITYVTPLDGAFTKPVASAALGDLLDDRSVRLVRGESLTSLFDGHANCFVETGRGKALLLDFNYDTEPLTGVFPYAPVGPMKLLGESRLNHLGKLAFEQIYWKMLLPGRHLPMPTAMSMKGKKLPAITS